MEKFEEKYIVYKIRNNDSAIIVFKNFEDAYIYLKKNQNQYDYGVIKYEYKVKKEYYSLINLEATNEKNKRLQ